mmetsp:Transcript_40010/g.107069  ORF Transcript_40010/g.107069 Transcript_40010/m.107069 type:complete len:302 (+) Transcript_40010:265-1170(+)
MKISLVSEVEFKLQSVPFANFISHMLLKIHRVTWHCFRIVVPPPQILFPVPDEVAAADRDNSTGDPMLRTYLGCPLRIEMEAQDHLDFFDISINAVVDANGGALGPGLPTGAALTSSFCSPSSRAAVTGGDGPNFPVGPGPGYLSCTKVSRAMDWVPSQDQAGMQSRLCMRASAVSGHQVTWCVLLIVDKCRYCAKEGDTLVTIAQAFSSDWLQLFGANGGISDPNTLAYLQLINLGAMYQARAGDTLALLAARFLTTVEALALSNPDMQISANDELGAGTQICVLPGICRTAEYSAPSPS